MRQFEQSAELDRVGDVTVEGKALRAEIMCRAGDDENLRPGKAFELDAGYLAHDAAAAIGADQPGGHDGLGFAVQAEDS